MPINHTREYKNSYSALHQYPPNHPLTMDSQQEFQPMIEDDKNHTSNEYTNLNRDEAEAGSILIALANHSGRSGGYSGNHITRPVYPPPPKVKLEHPQHPQHPQPQVFKSVSCNSMSIRNLLGDEDQMPLPAASNYEENTKTNNNESTVSTDIKKYYTSSRSKEHSFSKTSKESNTECTHTMQEDSDRVHNMHPYYSATPASMDVTQHSTRHHDSRMAIDCHKGHPDHQKHADSLQFTHKTYPMKSDRIKTEHNTVEPEGTQSLWYSRQSDMHSTTSNLPQNNQTILVPPNARMEPSNDYSRHFRQNPRARRNALHAYISYMTYTDLARKRMKVYKQTPSNPPYPTTFQPSAYGNAPIQDINMTGSQNRHGRHASQQTHEHNHISAAVVDKPVNSPLWHAHHQHSQSMPFHHILNQNHPPNHYSGIDPHRRNSFGNRPFTTETNSTKAPIHNQDYAHRPGLESRPPITMRHSVHSVTSMPNPEHISVLSHSSSSSPAYQGAMSMAAPISPTLHHYQAQPPHSFTAVHHPLTAFLRDNTNSDQPMSVEHAHSSAHLPSLSKSAVPMTPGTAPTSNFYHASSSLSPLQSVRNGES